MLSNHLLWIAAAAVATIAGYLLLCRVAPAVCRVRLDDDGLRFSLLRVVTVRRIPYAEITGAGKMARRGIARETVLAVRPAAASPADTAVVITRRGGRRCISLAPSDPDRFIRELGERVAAALERQRRLAVVGAR
ncbi:MAG TPA: hypothetical protein VF041_22575 [Gemmatimonadaceae bacterium]